MFYVSLIGTFLFGYLLGSIPFGLLVTKAGGYGDIRQIGSGNIGTTNVLRTGSKKLAALTLVLDALKAFTTVKLVQWQAGFGDVFPELQLMFGCLAALGALVGHCFPVWLKFKGGKAVAPFIGVLLALLPFGAMIFVAVWAIIAFLTRYSSLSALVASLAVTFFAWVTAPDTLAIAITAMLCLIIVKHWQNIRRLLAGTESRIGAKTG